MTAHQIVAKARNVPQISAATLRLASLLNDEAGGFEEAVPLIKSDGMLTAKLLRVCNSSAFGLAERVGTVDQALLLLGGREVHRLVLSFGFGNAMTASIPAYGLEANQLWQHSFLSATAAEKFVESGLCGETNPAVAFTAGLLHDIGKILMESVLTAEAQSAIQRHILAEGLGSVQAEREVLGTDHAEVGACLLHIWRIPEPMVEAVANHHRPVLRPSPQLSAVAHIANRLAHLAREDQGSYGFTPGEQVVQAFELNTAEELQLVESVRKANERALELQAIV